MGLLTPNRCSGMSGGKPAAPKKPRATPNRMHGMQKPAPAKKAR